MAEKDDSDHLQKIVNVPDRPICDSPVQNVDLHQLQNIAKGTTDPGVDCFDQ